MIALNKIIIEPVNNGWVVSMPSKEVEDMGVKIITSVMGEMNERIDPELKQIQEAQNSLKSIRTPHVFTFDTWEKVLAFLSSNVDDEKI